MYTTIQCHKPLIKFWYAIGVCPLNVVSSELENKNRKNSTGPSPEENVQTENSGCEIYKISGWKKAGLQFWTSFVLCCSVNCFSFGKLFLALTVDKENYSTAMIIASCVWCVYGLSCFSIYVVNLTWGSEICELLYQWQWIEGRIMLDYGKRPVILLYDDHCHVTDVSFRFISTGGPS